MAPLASIVAGMEMTERSCSFCGKPISIGEAWMESAKEGAEGVAHAGCVYGEPMDPEERSWWMAGEVRAEE